MTSQRPLTLILLVLTGGFLVSQAFRTVAGILATPLQADFGLDKAALGQFGSAFHFAFGAMQLFVGIGIDRSGVRRTMLAVFPLAILGATLSALASGFPMLVIGQVLIGLGCAPAFLVCTVFIARHYPAEKFAAVSGLTMAFGGLGMLLTGTPMAWLIEMGGWRMGFVALALASALAWVLVWAMVHEPQRAAPQPAAKETLREALGKFAALMAMPHFWGILVLASVGYASFLAMRGLWMSPMLIERHQFSLVQAGNVALIMSFISLFGPPLFGRLDPGPARRRSWLAGYTLVMAALYGVYALAGSVWVDVASPIVIGLLSGYLVLQYSDVRDAFPASMTGRALSLFTMVMFLGVAVVQWLTGTVAAMAIERGMDPYRAVLLFIALLLVLGALALKVLPELQQQRQGT